MRTAQKTIVVILVVALAPSAADACAFCFGDPNSSQTMDSAVWFLLGVTGFVQAGFIAMFVGFWARARQHRRRRDRFQLIVGGLQ